VNPSPELRARILAAAQAEPSPPRRAARQRVAAVGACVGLAVLALFLGIGGIDLVIRPHPYVACSLVGFGGVAILVSWGAVGRGGSMVGRPRALLVGPSLASVPSLVAWAVMTNALWADLPRPSETFANHCTCFALTLAFAVVGFGGLALLRRGSDPVHPHALGAGLGAASGAWASVLMDMHCPMTSTVHVFGGHILPIALLTLVGSALGGRVFGLR
jgi:hypothetical protein